MRRLRSFLSVTTLTALGIAGSHRAGAQSANQDSLDRQFVFFVKAANCRGPAPHRVLTGFRVKGMRGIVTALHGVAHCGLIAAADDSGRAVWTGLRIVRADVPHDVAV